jgi:hypothetical protein
MEVPAFDLSEVELLYCAVSPRSTFYLYVLHNPHTSDLRGVWACGVHSRLTTDQNRVLGSVIWSAPARSGVYTR